MKPSGGTNVSYSNGVWYSDTPFDDTNIIQDFARGVGSILNDASGATQQYERQVEQWQREKDFNDYANDMAHMRAAGLNPDMMYGKGAGVSSTPFPQVGSSAGLPKGDLIRSINDMVNQSRLVNAEIQKQEADADFAKAQADEIRHRSPYKDKDMDADVDLKKQQKQTEYWRTSLVYRQGLSEAIKQWTQGLRESFSSDKDGNKLFNNANFEFEFDQLMSEPQSIITDVANEYHMNAKDREYLDKMFDAMVAHDKAAYDAAANKLRANSAVTKFKADNTWFQFLDYFFDKLVGSAQGISNAYSMYQLGRRHSRGQ